MQQSKYFNYLPTPKFVKLYYLLFLIYLVVLCALLLRVPFIKNAGISPGLLAILFLVKVLAGIAIGWIAIHIYGPGNDYWDTNDYALEEYRLLQTNPGQYFINMFTSVYPDGYSGLFSSGNSYWNDLKGNIVIKLISVFNLFSRGNYYINSLFFNSIIFFGHVLLYRLFNSLYPGRQFWVIAGCFLLPSTLYFSSGIHKDGLVFLMLSVVVYCVHQSILKNRFTANRISLMVISLALLFLLRNFIFLALIPALFSWIWVSRTKWAALHVFASVYLLGGLLVFNIDRLVPDLKPLEIITARQAEYLKLHQAATQIELTPLQPTCKNFATNAPQALNHVFFRPYIWEIPVKSVLPSCIELLFYQILLLLFIFFRWKDSDSGHQSFLFFMLFFTITVFLFIGYVVPNLGSLVRYRSLYLPFIITPLLCLIDWKMLIKTIKLKI